MDTRSSSSPLKPRPNSRTCLYRMGWDDADLGLRCLGHGEHVTAPPSDRGGLGPVRWLRPPALDNADSPPHARLLLGTLAYVCHRSGT